MRKFLLILSVSAAIAAVKAQSLIPVGVDATAPPPAFNQINDPSATAPRVATAGATTAGATVFYSIGDPSDEEQQFVEMVNRARMNPSAEGLLLANTTDTDIRSAYNAFHVDLQMFVNAMAATNVTQPLAISPKLTAAARVHSQDMFNNTYQAHISITDNTAPLDRIIASGYTTGLDFQSIGENIYASVKSVLYGHAGFEVDWGTGANTVGGMQNPPGHREDIHKVFHREIGVGVVLGSKQATDTSFPHLNVGPIVVTQEFGSMQNEKPFITGVAYYDVNANGQYDLGEGLGGLVVSIDGQTTGAVTSRSGGYAIPLPGPGSYSLSFTGPNISQSSTVTVGANNVKKDLIATYVAPVVTGPAQPYVLQTNTYVFENVGGAISYQWRKADLNSPAVEGAENGLTGITTQVASDSPAIVSDLVASGTHAFRLLHTQIGNNAQYITFDRTIYVGNNGSLQFKSRLLHASTNEVAYAQISADEGVNWQAVFSQRGVGPNTDADSTFVTRTISLANYANQNIKLRFKYDVEASFFLGVGFGWYIDDISYTNGSELALGQPNDIPGNSFSFVPAAVANYGLQVRALLPGRSLPWTGLKNVSAIPAPAVVYLTGVKLAARNTKLQLDFEVQSGAAASFTVQSAADVTASSASWTAESNVIFTTVTPTSYSALVLRPTTATRFYRIVPN